LDISACELFDWQRADAKMWACHGVTASLLGQELQIGCRP